MRIRVKPDVETAGVLNRMPRSERLERRRIAARNQLSQCFKIRINIAARVANINDPMNDHSLSEARMRCL